MELVHGIPVYWKGRPEAVPVPAGSAGAGTTPELEKCAGAVPDREERTGPKKTEQKEAVSMKLVTGGAYQGKLAAARALTGKPEPRIWEGSQGEPADWGQVDVLNHFPELVRRTLAEAGAFAPGTAPD